jgi:hypothetical protein
MLRACLEDQHGKADSYTAERIATMLDFFDTMTGFYDDLQRLPKGVLSGVNRLRRKVKKLLIMQGGRAV